MRPSRNVSVLLLVAVCCLSLSAGSLAENVTFWTWEAGQRYNLINEELDLFRQAHPDVDLQYINRDIRWGEALFVAIVSGAAPDLTITHQDWHRDFAMQGLFLDLRPFIERDGFDLSVFPASVMEYYTGPFGEITGIPWDFTTILLGYNKDLFNERGVSFPTADWDLDDMVEAARRLTFDRDGDGENDVWGLHIGPLRQYVWRLWGVNFLTDDMQRTNLDDPRSIQAFEWLASLFREHNVVGAQGLATSSLTPWINGQIGINLSFPHYLISAGRTMTPEWDIELIPTAPVGYKIARGATGGWAIPANADNPEGAWEVIKFLASHESQLRMIEKGIGGVHLGAIQEYWTQMSPAELGLANRNSLRNRAAIAQAYQYASIDLYPTGYQQMWDTIINPAIESIILGHAAAPVALSRAAERVNAILRQAD
ncbi:MAG: sugar ABC transporter substrate-binding protein [Firmicutes bacterium]|nr:sugar ABC transporter substrate-binding protein [Bacillota bacterium]